MTEHPPRIVDGIPTDLPPELKVLMGVFYLYWKIDEVVDSINVTPALSKNERELLIKLIVPSRMGDLASDMQVLPSTLTAIADLLEQKGLAQRVRDPADRRAWLLSLTEEGIEKRRSLMARGAEIFTRVSGLSAEETQALSDLMLKVAHNIKADGLPEGAKSCR